MHFLVKNYPEKFSLENARRLSSFSKNVDKLLDNYCDAVSEDPLLSKIMNLETTVLELNEFSINILDNIPPLEKIKADQSLEKS